MQTTKLLRAIARTKPQSSIRNSARTSRPAESQIVTPQRPKVVLYITTLVAVGLFTGYGTYAFKLANADPSIARQHNIPEDVSDRYNNTAKDFDREIGLSETLMGLGWIRSWLVRQAEGNVLEVSVGTARNASYYNRRKCKTITMLDQSPEMIQMAKNKFKKAHPNYKTCRFVTQSAHEPIESPPQGFDTIVQTMGLCSTAQPVDLLRKLGATVNQKDGKILLLEHGRGYYEWLNRILDNGAPGHADQHGCWWNKDIGKIVEESGLEIVEKKRYHLGTTWWLILRPKQLSS